MSINTFVAKTDIPRLKRRLVEQICQGPGVPCVYRGGRMKAVHRGLGIRNRDFDALVQDCGRNLNKFKVPTREQIEFVMLLTPSARTSLTVNLTHSCIDCAL